MASFLKPNQVLGSNEVIPSQVLKNAKGLAIITVFKAGFLLSGRAGSGVIVARLSDGSWSAPSAIALAGAGAGGMIGFELTEFVFILNTFDALKSFSQMGSITLGGNISVAAGPLGRNAEAAATASLGSVAAVFSYSKTKGLFVGISLEGSVIIERRDANRKFYGYNCTAKSILFGHVNAPPSVAPLFHVLNSRIFNYRLSENDNYGDNYHDDNLYSDLSLGYESDDISNETNRCDSRKNTSMGIYEEDYDERVSTTFDSQSNKKYKEAESNFKPVSSSFYGSTTRWEDQLYDRDIDYLSSDKYGKSSSDDVPSRPKSKKPDFGEFTSNAGSTNTNRRFSSSAGGLKAVALYSFKGEQKGDLSFRKGDIISIIKRSESQDDWWTGRINDRKGIFPGNYVELV